MSVYEGAKTRFRDNSELPEESEAKVGIHQRSVLSPFLLAVVVDVVSEFAREGALSEFLYADGLFPMREIMEGLRNKFLECRGDIECMGLKVNLWKTKVMLSGGITKDGMSKSNANPCGIYSLSEKVAQFCVYSVVNTSMVDVLE